MLCEIREGKEKRKAKGLKWFYKQDHIAATFGKKNGNLQN